MTRRKASLFFLVFILLAFLVLPCQAGTFENFTTYTEVDPDGVITVSASRVTEAGMKRNMHDYIYADKGVNHFSGDFAHLFTFKSAKKESTNAIMALYGFTNTVGSVDTWSAHSIYIYLDDDPTVAFYLAIVGGTWAPSLALTAETVFYCIGDRIGTSFRVRVYSDAARTTLVGSRNVTDATPISARYIYPMSSYYTGHDIAINGVYLENLDLQEGPPTLRFNGAINLQVGISQNKTASFSRAPWISFSVTSMDQRSYEFNRYGSFLLDVGSQLSRTVEFSRETVLTLSFSSSSLATFEKWLYFDGQILIYMTPTILQLIVIGGGGPPAVNPHPYDLASWVIGGFIAILLVIALIVIVTRGRRR